MFDDSFLFAAFNPATNGNCLLALSVRQLEDFEDFNRFGWETFITPDVMVTSPFNIDDLPVTLVSQEDVIQENMNRSFSCVLGDLAAYTPANMDLLKRLLPPVVKVNFITSPIDGVAFLPASDSDKMQESAVRIAGELRSMGYLLMASTWYRNDQALRVWELEDGDDMEMFPFNMVAVQDPRIAKSFQYTASLFSEQMDKISVEHKALEGRLNDSIDEKNIENSDYRKYIQMLEDAMIALQPSEKIKLG